MSIRGKQVAEIHLRKSDGSQYVQVTAYTDDMERLFDRFLFMPFWHDRIANLIKAVEREVK